LLKGSGQERSFGRRHGIALRKKDAALSGIRHPD